MALSKKRKSSRVKRKSSSVKRKRSRVMKGGGVNVIINIDNITVTTLNQEDNFVYK